MRLLTYLGFGMALLVSMLFWHWAFTFDNPCSSDNEGSDYWYEVCLDQGEIDLGNSEPQPVSLPVLPTWEA